jgi:hypothetical protein
LRNIEDDAASVVRGNQFQEQRFFGVQLKLDPRGASRGQYRPGQY